MSIQLKRKEAIKIIQMYYLLNLSIEEKGDILFACNKNVYNKDKECWDKDAVLLQRNNKYIIDEYNYSGIVTNCYIEQLIFDLLGKEIRIIDEIVSAGEKCVCCGYITSEKVESYGFVCGNLRLRERTFIVLPITPH